MYVWGDGRTPEFVSDLQKVGVRRAWIGYDQDERRHKFLVGAHYIQAAKTAGYLVTPYDVYSNAQDAATGEDSVSIWPGDLYPDGCIVDRDGKLHAGFGGRGCELSSEALARAEATLRPVGRRVDERLRDKPNSYFLDVDAFGDLYDDFSPSHLMTPARDRENRIKRMRRLRQRGVVLGSEEGAGWSVPELDFAHGALSVQNSALWRKKKDFGPWWPPERPGIFFRPIDPGGDFADAKYDPAFRLPLFEAAFHSSVVATDRWDVPLAKFPELMKKREMIELLYGAPSMWAMDRQQLRESREALAKLAAFFEPLHRQIGALPLESFEWLTPDRLVQRTRFGNELMLTANFSSDAFQAVKAGCIEARWITSGRTEPWCP
jgi:hypothetical protein